MSDLVTLDAIRAAAAVLRGVTVRTPLLPIPQLGDRVFVKPESLQPGGSFKLRGAYAFIASLSPEVRARGVVAPSSGNHAQAVALAAQRFGIPATVIMPTTVTAAKRAGVERLGAALELAGTTTSDRMNRAIELVRETGRTLVPPYDDARIVAAQATVGLEIAEDLEDVATVIVPVGGGGISAGVATAIKLLRPTARVFGVEPEGAAKLTRALAAGSPVDVGKTAGLADGLLAVSVGDVPFRHHQAYIDGVVTMPDAVLARAVRFLLDRAKLVVEPSGAVGVAALLEGRIVARGATVVVLTGGNVEWESLRTLLG